MKSEKKVEVEAKQSKEDSLKKKKPEDSSSSKSGLKVKNIKIKKPAKGEVSKSSKVEVSKTSKGETSKVNKSDTNIKRDSTIQSNVLRPVKTEGVEVSKLQEKRGIRFFIGSCNSLLSYYLIDELRNDHEEDEDEGKANLFIGTVNSLDPVNPPPSNMKRLISSNNKPAIINVLRDADVIIYNIRTDSLDDIHFAAQSKFLLLTLLEFKESNPETDKTLILISSAIYWESEEKDKELRDNDFLTRHTPPSKLEQRDLENGVLSACRIASENDYGAVHPHKRSYVICPGLVYGMGEEYEESLYHIFMKAWNYLPGENFTIVGEGDNIVPTVHVKDLAKMIARIAVNSPNPREHPYILAVDKAEGQSQETIIQAIATKMGIENIKKIKHTEVEASSKELIYPLTLNLNMKIGEYLEGLMGDDWVSRNGLVQNIDKVFGELKEARGLRCVKTVFIGPPAAGKTHFSNW